MFVKKTIIYSILEESDCDTHLIIITRIEYYTISGG